jgi:hypothetical protein
LDDKGKFLGKVYATVFGKANPAGTDAGQNTTRQSMGANGMDTFQGATTPNELDAGVGQEQDGGADGGVVRKPSNEDVDPLKNESPSEGLAENLGHDPETLSVA